MADCRRSLVFLDVTLEDMCLFFCFVFYQWFPPFSDANYPHFFFSSFICTVEIFVFWMGKARKSRKNGELNSIKRRCDFFFSVEASVFCCFVEFVLFGLRSILRTRIHLLKIQSSLLLIRLSSQFTSPKHAVTTEKETWHFSNFSSQR